MTLTFWEGPFLETAIMTDDAPISRQAFDETAARLGISGTADHMDDLYGQLRGVLAGAETLLKIDVSGAEPDMAFMPNGPSSAE